jgi:hypothetical protein
MRRQSLGQWPLGASLGLFGLMQRDDGRDGLVGGRSRFIRYCDWGHGDQHARGERIGSDQISFHFGAGLAVRNLCRERLKDSHFASMSAGK